MIDSFDSERLLMSEDIKGNIPSLENPPAPKNENSFLLSTIVLACQGSEPELVVGSISGISREDVLKIDIRTPVTVAYGWVKKSFFFSIDCLAVEMSMQNDSYVVPGKYKVRNIKLYDIDHVNKMCTLGLDLLRDSE